MEPEETAKSSPKDEPQTSSSVDFLQQFPDVFLWVLAILLTEFAEALK